MTYIAPQIFREWTPLIINNNINKLKPKIIKIGSLPLILWFINDKPNIIINSCKHLGNSLKTAKIEKNNLICQFHKEKYNETDNFGTTIIQNGIIWWSYKSYNKLPFFKSNKKSYQIEIEIEIDLITFILNELLEIKEEIKYILNKNKKIILIKSKDKRIIYKYPYKLLITNKKLKYTEELSILPISTTKIKIFINIYNKYLIPYIYYIYILKKNKYENKIEIDNLNIKKYFILKKNNNNYIEEIYKLYENYIYYTEYVVEQFIKNRNYY